MAISHCLSKSVRDSAALLDISSELMPGEPYVSPKQNGKFLDSVHIEPKNLKIGFMTHDFEGNRLNSDIIQLTKIQRSYVRLLVIMLKKLILIYPLNQYSRLGKLYLQ